MAKGHEILLVKYTCHMPLDGANGTLEALRKQSAEAAEQAKKEAERREKVRFLVFLRIGRIVFRLRILWQGVWQGLARSGIARVISVISFLHLASFSHFQATP
jgi:hypothetical protein